jgi:ribose/xylose/arabinose/galactoside ABC-type transport system permease subunit
LNALSEKEMVEEQNNSDRNLRSKLESLIPRQNLAVMITLLGICLITAILNPVFITPTNLINVIRQISILGIVSCGMAMLMISGGIDLSVGATISLAGVIAGKVLVSGYGEITAVVVGILVGALVGLVIGILVATTRVQPFILTLGMLSLLGGFALIVTNGRQIPNLNGKYFEPIGGGMVGFIPVPVLLFILVALFSHFLLRNTKWGRNWYAIGGNEETAYLSGINVKTHKIAVYVLNGFLAGVAAVILASRIGAALPVMGNGYELRSIAAVVIGGVSLMGGRGSIFGAVLGVLLLGVISNSLNMLNVSSFYQNVTLGAIILIAVIANQYGQMRASK